MKTVYRKIIVDVLKTRMETDIGGVVTIKWKDEIKSISAAVFNQYQYEDEPLYFLKQKMTDFERYMLIKKFDEWYGDTEQETTVWALEYQIIVRMLLTGHLIVNPKYLSLEDVMEKILFILKN